MNKEDRGLLGLLLLLGGILVVAGVIVWQLRSQVRVVVGLREEVRRETEAQAKYADLSNEFSRVQVNEAGWTTLLLSSEEDVARFAREVEAIAAQEGLVLAIEFEDLPTRVELSGKQGRGLGVELKLSGSYEALMAFVRSLETGSYLIKQESVQLARQTSGEFNLSIVGELVMKSL